MRKIAILLFVSIFLFSCQKHSTITPTGEGLLGNAYSKTFKVSLQAKMLDADYKKLDFNTARHTALPANSPDIVRIGFAGSSIANDFVLVETDKVGKVLDGKIIHLNYTALPDERSRKVNINGSMLRSALDRSSKEQFRIVNGGLKKDDPRLMEDESIPEVVVYAQYMENKIGFSTWYAFGNMGGLSGGYGGYGWSSNGGGSGGSASNNTNMQEEDPFDFFELKVDSTVKNNAKVNCVMNKLFAIGRDHKLKGFTVMQSLWVPFWSNSSDVVYKLSDTLGVGDNGQTTYREDLKGLYSIEINSSTLNNRTPLLIAGTIVHETIHAYLVDQFKTYGKTRFYELIQMAFNGITTPLNQHDFMSQFYISRVATVLADFDGNKHQMQYYQNIAWEGLDKTPLFTSLPKSIQNAIKSNLDSEYLTADKACK